MQTWITDFNFTKSALNLDKKRFYAQIYEAIHILASLLDVNDKLVNPKRSVKNHPAAKLWKTDEDVLLHYIKCHSHIWKINLKMPLGYYRKTITGRNIKILNKIIKNKQFNFKDEYPKWITEKLITTHRSVLIQKKPDYYKHLWPNCPENLKMRYDWKG